MAKAWYAIHIYSGYDENKVSENIRHRFQSMGLENKVSQVLIPTQQISEIKEGKKKISTKKFFPGYALIEMELTDDTWYAVKNTPGVLGFVGAGTRPIPLAQQEIDYILAEMKKVAKKPKLKVIFEKGESVRIVDGPFTNFIGIIEEIYPERGTLKLEVTIFGRTTPVELNFLQVERI
ncbi:Transcription termination/antitermination protein NusG [subsurface metagenome]